jgi:predicted DNA-binding transcriptional regulator AlpA
MTTSWAVTLTFPGNPPESALTELEDNLGQDYFAAAVPARNQFSVTGTIVCPEWRKASDVVSHAVAGVIGNGLEPISVEAMDLDEYDRRANAPTLPDMVSAPEAATILGVTRQRVHQLVSENPRFPEPLFRLGSGPVWDATAIRAFDAKWERKPGRPAKVSA